MKSVYLDYAASAPVALEVSQAMAPYFEKQFGNPGSVHGFGREAQAALDASRQTVAKLLGVDFLDVIFVASATEANNLMLQGAVKQYHRLNKDQKTELPHIITSVIEHESVLAVCRDLEEQQLARVSYIPVDHNGFVGAAAISRALRPETILVSVMYFNNVTGAVQPLSEIGAIIKSFKKDKLSPKHYSQYLPRELLYPIFHTDAAQAIHSLELIELAKIGVETMTISSHKIYGPKGGGALAANFPISLGLAPCLIGGLQEFGLRAGTPDLPNIVGFARAMSLVRQEIKQEIKHAKAIRQQLLQGIIKAYPRAVVNSHPPYIDGVCNISFPGFGLEELLYRFDQRCIAVAAGSACSAKALNPSHVLRAMGLTDSVALSSVRFSFGRYTSKQEVSYCLEQLPYILS